MLKAEAEVSIEKLKTFPIDQVGSPEWLQQMLIIEKINVEAHKQASSNQFEQIVDFIKTFEKLEVLVHELIASDLYLTNCLPLIKSSLPKESFVRLFIVERSMTVLLNLIELVVFKPEGLSTDGLLPLIDFCSRKLAVLTSLDLSEISGDEPNEEKKSKFSNSFACLSIIWCLSCSTSDDSFPISITKRLVSEDDLIPSLCELIIKQPWRTVKKGKIIKWSDNGLITLPSNEALRVCKPEAHTWTALQQLLEPKCLELTKWDESRKSILLQIEGLLSEILIDQLPPLQSLRKTLQYLRVNEFPPPKFSAIIEQLPPMNEEFSQKFDWKKLAENSLKKHFKLHSNIMQKEMMEISEFLSIFEEN